MSGAAAVLRRVRGVVGTRGLEGLDPAGVRLVFAQVLYDGHGVPDWHRQAACREQDPGVFFPEPGQDAQTSTAKRICAGCPVRNRCLADVMTWEPQSARHGVVGGLSAWERRQLHRIHQSQKSGEAA
jgi:WhiB family transcriptional regulator, redox-sensing transcriptional regulator